MRDLSALASLDRIVAAVLAAWPEHSRFLATSLAGHSEAELGQLDRLAERVAVVCGDRLTEVVASYRRMCGAFLEEEIHFARHGTYRLTTEAQAQIEVYENMPFMRAYMEGLLLSQLLWFNHAQAFLFFVSEVIPRIGRASRLIEIGPGHGFYLAHATEAVHDGTVVGADISPESLRQTRETLDALGCGDDVTLVRRDIYAMPTRETHDVVIVSEVLEHLERPRQALDSVFDALSPGGLLFANVPVNSPAPDHIYLFRHPDEVAAMIGDAGFAIERFVPVPMAGRTLEKAVCDRVTISCLVLAQRPRHNARRPDGANGR